MRCGGGAVTPFWHDLAVVPGIRVARNGGAGVMAMSRTVENGPCPGTSASGQPWDRQAGEPLAAYLKFLTYRHLGPQRTLLKAYHAQRAGRGLAATAYLPGRWTRLSSRWQWRRRARSWDWEQGRPFREARVRAALERREHAARQAARIQAEELAESIAKVRRRVERGRQSRGAKSSGKRWRVWQKPPRVNSALVQLFRLTLSDEGGKQTVAGVPDAAGCMQGDPSPNEAST
jgi:hypothetical protein